MSAQSAGGFLMWCAGAMLGVGAATGELWPLSAGAMLSMLGVIYIRKFAER
jgi:hypothetical protein